MRTGRGVAAVGRCLALLVLALSTPWVLGTTPASAATLSVQVVATSVPGPNQSGTGSNPLGFATATVSCPAQSVLISGGGLVAPSAADVSVHLLGSFPSDASGLPVTSAGASAQSWTAWAESGLGSGPNTTTAWALCATGGPGASQVALSSVSGPNGASGFATATATCPAGMVLTGGGADTIPGNLGNPSGQPSPLHLNGSYPSGASGNQVGSGADPGSWSAAAEEGADVGPGTSTTAFAICATTSLSLQVAAVTVGGPFGAGGMVTPTAGCPAGTVLFGGGAFTQPPSNSTQPSPLHLAGTFPSDAAGNPLPGGATNPGTWAGFAREGNDVGNPPGTGTRTASFALCAQTGPGQVLATGYNGYGQLCNATTTPGTVASGAVAPLNAGVISVAAGSVHSLALTSSGTVFACGRNSFGQLGNGTTTDSPTPVAVALPGGVVATAIAADEYHSLALTSSGTVYAWGHNAFGQLGNGTTTDSPTPVAVAVPGAVVQVAAGWAFDLALTSAGTVYAWGYNGDGELGTASSGTCAGSYPCSTTPVAVSLGGASVTAIAAGWDHSLAIRSDGTVLAWGLNNYGQLGTGDTTNRLVPAPALGGVTVAAIACGGAHSLAIRGSDGRGLAWGLNNHGQLGAGTAAAFLTTATPLASSASLTAIAAGAYHSLAIASGGAPLAWGDNAAGQLGDGTTTDRSSPVSPLAPATSPLSGIAAGWAHSLFVK